ncbi:MAG TPA: GGDEF domain-containing protein [Usitatibacter sp.]
MFEGIVPLLSSSRHFELLASRRAEVIVRRVREAALVFAALTVAWIPLDAMAFGASHWQGLAVTRLLAALALAALASICGAWPYTPAQARSRLLILYAIPIVFFAATLEILLDVPRQGVGAGIAAAYSFVPFVLVAGISAFPLTALESLGLATTGFLGEAWALSAFSSPMLPLTRLEGLWLLFLIAGVATVGAMSQLQLLAALVMQAARDPLTHCLRRESGEELLDAQCLLATRRGEPLCVLFADIDRFKPVNDEFGHEAGDRVLAQVAESLRGVLRESDVLVRWGGEEFLVVLPGATSAEAVSLIERLRARGFERLPDGRRVTMSIGIVEFSRDMPRGAAELVALADKRMYAAKQAGRNRYAAGDSGQTTEIFAPE